MNGPSVWNRNFVPLFWGQSVSAIGSQVTFIALPLIAVLNHHASPGAMGLLGAVDNLPYLLVGLWVGVLVDRNSRRRLMILSDVLRAAAVLWLPIGFWLGVLDFPQLCVVAFVIGLGNIVFDVACQAQLPELVDESRLIEANGALATSSSLATVGAPGLVGLLIGWIGAPVAMLIDAVSYLISLIGILAIKQPEEHRPAKPEATWRQVSAGLRLVFQDRRLLGLGGGAALLAIGMNAALAVLIYYLADQLHFDPVVIGLVFLSVGVGGLLGALAVSRLGGQVSPGVILITGPLLACLGLLIAAAAGSADPAAARWWILLGALTLGCGILSYQMTAAGLRQSLAPDAVRGRVLGTLRFLEWGSMPLGSLLGGALGELIGAPGTLALSAVLIGSGCLWAWCTPLRQLRAVGPKELS